MEDAEKNLPSVKKYSLHNFCEIEYFEKKNSSLKEVSGQKNSLLAK